jgi:hypothetical protein
MIGRLNIEVIRGLQTPHSRFSDWFHAYSLHALLVILLALVTPASSDGSLIGHWPFDDSGDTTQDVAGGHDAILTNVTRAPGQIGSGAVSFNGVDSVGFIGGIGTPLELRGSYTIAGWIKLHVKGKEQTVLSMDDRADYSGGYSAHIVPDAFVKGYDGLIFEHNNGSRQSAGPVVNIATNLGSWQHIAVTFDGSNRNMFISGKAPDYSAPYYSAATSGGITQDEDDPLLLGAYKGADAALHEFFDGELDDLRIYDEALDLRAIEALADNVPLVIVESPQSTNIEVGESATFQVVIGGTLAEEATYQWFVNNELISGADQRTYQTPKQTAPGESGYSVKVTEGGITLESGTATLTVSNPPPGLLAHWSFDEEFGDTVPSETGNYPGQVINGARVPGRVGAGALRLNGTNAYMLVGGENTPIGLANSAYTISWWQKVEPGSSDLQYIYSMDDNDSASPGGYSAYISSDQTLYLDHNGLWISGSKNTGSHVQQEWEQLAVAYDGEILRFYYNGILKGEWSEGPLQQKEGNVLVIGALKKTDGSLGYFFKGMLDDIRIYNVALSVSEIRDLGGPPAIEITEQPLGYRLGAESSVTLEVAALAINTTNAVTYQWERDGTPLPGAVGPMLVVRGSEPGAYRVLVKTGDDVRLYSDEARVDLVVPSAPRLLLHYDFENDSATQIVDSTGQFNGVAVGVGHVPGRVGKFAIKFDRLPVYPYLGFIRVPAAGTDLELVGSQYTIAWWMMQLIPSPKLSASSLHVMSPFAWPSAIFELGSGIEKPNRYAVRSTGYASYSIDLYHGSAVPVTVRAEVADAFTWQHVAVVYNASSNLVYINGKFVGGQPSPEGLIGSGRDDLMIGKLGDAPLWAMTGFEGLLDDFRIYNYALSDAEIASLATPPPPEPSVVVHKSFDSVVLSWQVSDPAQSIEVTSNLVSGTEWKSVGSLFSTNAVYQLETPGTNRAVFYRLRVP